MKRVLIVDDEPLIRLGLAKALKDLAEVEAVESGKEASSRFASSSYDVCFLDVYLPDVNGIDVLREIRRLSPETIVVMMTAYADEEMRNTIGEEAHRFLEKPLDLGLVKSIVQ